MGELDKQIKENLEARKISPSAGSWDKLSSQLENQDKKKVNYKWFIGIAASFVAGILIASLFGNGGETEIKVVNTPQSDASNFKTVNQENIFSKEVEGELVYDSKQLKEIVGELPESKPKVSEVVSTEKSNIKVRNIPSKSSNAQHKKTLSPQNENVENKALLAIRDSGKVENATEVLDVSPKELAQVSEQEVDALLEKARRNVRLRQFNNPYARVSSKELLESIEVENKDSFKEKIFLALESGFQHVKSSVIK
ncbi:hypothetical protein [Mesonia sp. K4-1]|jgi:hypothetical protein|uniref:hypothetical protein n=1 Tax=Mesonia sp. K4-1 TaxID=2602760 RepID=UPI0011CAC349|nr:hypothetical protein [Mesonia sp. K4-1]TXK77070.1 hypothetical protein FT986_05140 [Mesonia sp. K4-1]